MRSDDESKGEEEEEGQSKEKRRGKEKKRGKKALEGPGPDAALVGMNGDLFGGEEKSFAQALKEGKKEL